MSVMRYLLLLLILLLAASSAEAQRIPTPVLRDSLPATQPVPDTAAAIHRLFAAKRHQSGIAISGTTAVGLLSLLVAENTRHSYTIDAAPIIATGISLLSIPAIIAEIGFYRQFTIRKEARALSAFRAHKLPAKIRRLLLPAYFEAGPSR